MARFYNTQLVKPISQYAPAPLKYIDEAGASLQDQSNKGMLAVDEFQKALNIKGGYKTQQRAKDLVAEYKPQLDQVSAELNSTGNIQVGIEKVAKLVNDLKANPEYQDVMADQAKTASGEPDKLITQPGFNTYVQDIIDPNTKMFKQTKKGERYDDRWYQAVAPGDTNKEYKPYYDQVKPVIDKIYNTPVTKTWEDENGAIHTQTLQEGIETESIRKEQVRATLKDYFDKDPNALNKQSIIYNKALAAKEGREYNAESALNDVTNAFLGAYSTEKEIQKLGADRITRAGKGGKGSGSGEGTEGSDNRTLNIIKEANATGGATTNAAEQAALLNGSFDKDTNTVTINAQDRTIYLNTAKQGTSEEINRSVLLNKAIPLKNQENQIVEKGKELINVLPASAEEADSPQYQQPDKDGIHFKKYYKVPGTLGVTEFDTATNRSKFLKQEDFERTPYFKENLNKVLTNDPSYQALQEEAKKQGIDLADADLNKNIKDNTKTVAALETLNVALTSINGQMTMIPGTGKNTFTDDEGNLIVKGDAFISKEQMEEQIAPTGTFWTGGYKNLKEAGLIKEHTIYTTNKTTGEQIKTEGYVMKIITPVQGQDVENTTRNIDVNRWGEAKWVADNVPLHVSEVKDELFKVKTEKKIAKFQKDFSKNPDQYISDWDYEFNQFLNGKATDPEGNAIAPPNLTDQERSELNTYKVSVLDNTKLDKKEKAKELFKIKMALTDPQGYNLMFGAPPADVGKSQEGWKQTPASPLK